MPATKAALGPTVKSLATIPILLRARTIPLTVIFELPWYPSSSNVALPFLYICIPGAVGVKTDNEPTFKTPVSPTTIPFGDTNIASPG